jgi:hypothetical protein
MVADLTEKAWLQRGEGDDKKREARAREDLKQ